MAVRLIDLLETLESDEQKGARAALRLPAQLFQLQAHHLFQRATVQEAGRVIAKLESGEAGFNLSQFCDVM